uniref:Uncharacterized protein n=1 Tax=Mandrillus leucophaeus TaxID=9568 RepID=A0A2K5YTX6_MANLE
MYVVGYIKPSKFRKIIYVNMISVILSFILMFGNLMCLSSYYSSSLLMTWVFPGLSCGLLPKPWRKPFLQDTLLAFTGETVF